MRLSIIVAIDKNYLIGRNNTLPWHLPADLAYFKQTTWHKAIIMGRKTYESIGKALPERRNVIISRNTNFNATNCEVFSTPEAALKALQNEEEVMVIGGASLYEQLLPQTDRIYLTEVQGKFTGDAYFPKLEPNQFKLTRTQIHKPDAKNLHPYTFKIFNRTNS
jgi:dihydrofolate reductase